MIDVVMRCRNDIAMLPGTLAGLAKQSYPFRLLAFDNGSTDGSRELLAKHADVMVDVPAGKYIPGRVLNDAMRKTTSPLVAFLNSDCEPLDEHWLTRLLEAMEGANVSAAFGRQLPRPGCLPWFERDTEMIFGDGVEHANGGTAFPWLPRCFDARLGSRFRLVKK